MTVLETLKRNWFYFLLGGVLIFYFWVLIVYTMNKPGYEAEYYDLKGQGRFICVETWDTRHTNEKTECMRFEPSQEIK